jgi:integral membrane protein
VDQYGLFFWVSRSEGISFLLLLGVAMPLKYIWSWPLGVEVVGMAHGLLFIAYEVLALRLKSLCNWSVNQWLIIALCAFLPFGPFYVEKKYLS